MTGLDSLTATFTHAVCVPQCEYIDIGGLSDHAAAEVLLKLSEGRWSGSQVVLMHDFRKPGERDGIEGFVEVTAEQAEAREREQVAT